MMDTPEKHITEWPAKKQSELLVSQKPPKFEQPMTMAPLASPVFGNSPQKVFTDPGNKSPLVIAIANQKGGVAKTTTVVSLGGALAGYQKEVLLVDLDAQANLTLALGKNPAHVRQAITDVLFNSASLLSISQETGITGLDLVPSNSGMEMAERFLPVREEYETILQRILVSELNPSSPVSAESSKTGSSLKGQSFPVIGYDYIILDCPPNMGAVTLNALVAADLLIIPTQPEFFSAHALRTMMTSIRQVQTKLNPHLTYRVLITMLDRRNRIHRQIREQINKTFSDGVFQTIIEVDTKLRESAVEGKPIMYFNPMTRSAQQYAALAQEIIQYDQ
jgi:chromosome partitioning protein